MIATGLVASFSKREQRSDRAGRGSAAIGAIAGAVDNFDLVPQHVLRQSEHDRTRTAGGRDAKGARDIFWNTPSIVDPRRPFCDRRKKGRHVDFLEALAVLVGAVEVADEQDHRCRILEGDMHPARGVGRAGAAGDEGDAGPSGHLPIGVGHIGDPAFLAADHQVNFRRVVQRVQYSEEAFTRYGENTVAALDLELVD